MLLARSRFPCGSNSDGTTGSVALVRDGDGGFPRRTCSSQRWSPRSLGQQNSILSTAQVCWESYTKRSPTFGMAGTCRRHGRSLSSIAFGAYKIISIVLGICGRRWRCAVSPAARRNLFPRTSPAHAQAGIRCLRNAATSCRRRTHDGGNASAVPKQTPILSVGGRVDFSKILARGWFDFAN